MAEHPIAIKNGNVSPEDYARNIGILANLETIRVNQFELFQRFETKTSGSDTTAQKLKIKPLESGFVYIITSITAIDISDAAYQVRIGFINGSTDNVVKSSTVSAMGDSVDFVGQLLLKEGDVIFAEFRAIGANDVIQINVNGYRIRR